jgi:beta-lactamase class A
MHERAAASPTQDTTDVLRRAFREAEAEMGGILGVRASRLDGSDPVVYQDEDVAPAASTIKVFLLGALLDDVANGRRSLDEEIVLGAEDRVTGSGVLKALQPARAHTLRDLATLMIIVSDNTATNLVLDVVGLDRFRAWIEGHGWHATRANGKLQVRRDAEPSTTTARDLHDAMASLWRGELLPVAETEVARTTLLAQQYTHALARDIGYDPYSAELGESSLTIASKGGSLRGVRNEAAVIRSGSDGFVVAITTRDCPDSRFHVDNVGSLCVSRVTRLVHDRYLGAGAAEASR